MTRLRLLALPTALLLLAFLPLKSRALPPDAAEDPSARVEALLSRMTLEEKVGQLNQLSGGFATGPENPRSAPLLDEIRKGRVGSVLNIVGAERTRAVQRIAVEETRLKVPLLFALDVIHGYRTIFPIPLAEAASWDLAAIERSARIAAVEASAAGIDWTFAPMVDVARDPRWGRVMEGAGEDPYLGARVAEARVHGFQGHSLSQPDAILACAKHFAGYGAVEAGREYNTTTISVREMRNVYLPPFQAAVKAGCATVMNAFNDFDGVPASGNTFLVKQVLKGEWSFGGLVVSDWNSFGEMIAHGVAADRKEAAALAMNATSDVDMESRVYVDELPALVREGRISEAQIDDAVRRILLLKARLGLFDDPYRGTTPEREASTLRARDHLAAARDMARRSVVLLRNEGNLLPLSPALHSIAVIGPLADSGRDMLGAWAARGRGEEAVTLMSALRDRLGRTTALSYTAGCAVSGECTGAQIAEAVEAARQADLAILAVGEGAFMSGEGASLANIDLPGRQLDLVKAIHATGKPVVALVMGGRPMTINWLAENVPTVVYAWLLGSEAGPALVDVLVGDYNPSGHLPISIPYAVGQIPVYYAHKSTGRPRAPGSNRWDVTRYRDIPNEPLFPFGFGLSYTTFAYGPPELSSDVMKAGQEITVTVPVTNTGSRDGETVVQLYVRDVVASVTRPVKELKGFAKVALAAGESRRVAITLKADDLRFWDRSMRFTTEPGELKVMTGPSSDDTQEASFRLE